METLKSNSKEAIQYSVVGTILLLVLIYLKVYEEDEFITSLITLLFGIASIAGLIRSIKGRNEVQTNSAKAALIINILLTTVYLILIIISTLKKLNYL